MSWKTRVVGKLNIAKCDARGRVIEEAKARDSVIIEQVSEVERMQRMGVIVFGDVPGGVAAKLFPDCDQPLTLVGIRTEGSGVEYWFKYSREVEQVARRIEEIANGDEKIKVYFVKWMYPLQLLRLER